MTPQGRREAAYRRYVNQHIRQRQKMIAKAQKASRRKLKLQLKSHPPVSEPIVSSGVEPAGQFSGPMTGSSSEAGDAPITEPAP